MLPRRGLVARYGGESSQSCFPIPTDAALLVAERLRSAVAIAALPHAASPVCSRVTLSIGIALQDTAIDDAPGFTLLVEEATETFIWPNTVDETARPIPNEENTELL